MKLPHWALPVTAVLGLVAATTALPAAAVPSAAAAAAAQLSTPAAAQLSTAAASSPLPTAVARSAHLPHWREVSPAGFGQR